MKVLITGAAGVLGRAVAALLEKEADVEMRLTDVVPVETPHEFIRADLACWEEVQHLCDGVDEVLHIAAIHLWKKYTPEQYIDCNVKGTCNVLRAAAKAGVGRLIYTSSIAAMGYSPERPDQLPFDESKPCRPVEDIYGISKHVGEQLCRMFSANDGLRYIALRPGCFIPADELSVAFGLGLLSTRVHAGDVAMAHVLALRSAVSNEEIIITAKVPFTREDGAALLSDAPSVILKYFPRAKLLQERGVELPETIRSCYDIGKAQALLGYRPKWDFGLWLEKKLAQ